MALVAVVEHAEPLGETDLVWIAFVVAVFGLAARTIRGARRYERPA